MKTTLKQYLKKDRLKDPRDRKLRIAKVGSGKTETYGGLVKRARPWSVGIEEIPT